MYIFIISILVVSFIALCFYKKKFWENRYLVLIIGSLLALVITLSTNFVRRNELPTTYKTLWVKQIQAFHLHDSLLVADYSAYNDSSLSYEDIIVHKNDSVVNTKRPSHYLFYINDNGFLRLRLYVDNETISKKPKNIYFGVSNDNRSAYIGKFRKKYSSENEKWISKSSLPPIETLTCVFLPKDELNAIPDSLIIINDELSDLIINKPLLAKK